MSGSSEGGLRENLRVLLVRYVLGVNDTPHRIALGVFLGFLVGATPTLGFQLILYVALATVFRANKVSGILPVFLSNPITAVPLYYFNWALGNLVTGGNDATANMARHAIERLVDEDTPLSYLLSRFLRPETWQGLGRLVLELWVGSILVGLVSGVLFYFLSLRAVSVYKRRREVSSLAKVAAPDR